VGDFTATKVDGKVQKNGGNVAGYFCTPEGYVLNAVVGPVSAQKLLSEAQWAVRVEDQLRGGKRDWRHDAQLVAAAHQAQAGDRVHGLLAQLPLEPLPKVQAAVFTGLGNEKIADNRYGVLTAAAGLEKANKEGLPILLVFYADATSSSSTARSSRRKPRTSHRSGSASALTRMCPARPPGARTSRTPPRPARRPVRATKTRTSCL